jgi:hypothetical protein
MPVVLVPVPVIFPFPAFFTGLAPVPVEFVPSFIVDPPLVVGRFMAGGQAFALLILLTAIEGTPKNTIPSVNYRLGVYSAGGRSLCLVRVGGVSRMKNRLVRRYGSGDRLNKSSAPFAKPAKRCPSTGSGQSALMVGSARREAWWCVRWVRGFRQEVKNGIGSKECATHDCFSPALLELWCLMNFRPSIYVD